LPTLELELEEQAMWPEIDLSSFPVYEKDD
jgi:hypothetical protein